MENILDDHLKGQTISLSRYKFIGKLAAKSWKYDGYINFLKNIRIIILIAGFVTLYPVLNNYLFHGLFTMELFIERLIFFIILLTSSAFFHKLRFVSILIALLPTGLILLFYLTNLQYLSLWNFAVNAAIFLIIASGIYFHFKEKKLRKDLNLAIYEGHPDAILRK